MCPGARGALGPETQEVPPSPPFLCFNLPQRYLEILHGDVSQLGKDMDKRRKRNKQHVLAHQMYLITLFPDHRK